MEYELKFAVLIDADNVSDKYIKIILDETANCGIATYKRIYGDWTNPRFASWKSVLLDNSIIPMQQYSYTTGKNATDSAMIIDAMDLLYSKTVDGFCIVSSDSDFTRLAARLREAGMQVIGMGESKTPKPFISACHSFKYLDVLYEQLKAQEEAEHKEKQKQNRMAKIAKRQNLDEVRNTINAIIENFSDDDNWIFSGKLGDQLSKRLPDFDVRNYGFVKLTSFIFSMGDYEVKSVNSSNGQKQYFYRIKEVAAEEELSEEMIKEETTEELPDNLPQEVKKEPKKGLKKDTAKAAKNSHDSSAGGKKKGGRHRRYRYKKGQGKAK